ncbi:MAG: class I SAM-dependent methyltransferase [Victivallaceae bacterium]|nr:class I SAM-dependent methyltransferase [Victivallaceae bacterium]
MEPDIRNEFNRISEEYDAKRRLFIPCFDAFYRDSTDCIAGSLPRPPRRVLDLGAGTGLLAMHWMEHFPAAEYVLMDIASDMLDGARRRFSGRGNVSFVEADYAAALPGGRFDAIVSALSIHHLEDGCKRRLFRMVRESLADGGVFVNHDQFDADTPAWERRFEKIWISHLESGELTADDLDKWRTRRGLDRECTVGDEIEMLRDGGFEDVSVVFRSQKFCVIAAFA